MSSVNAQANNRDAASEAEDDRSGPITAATNRLIATAESFAAADLEAPSKCAGWTRAHVLAHVARNADGLTNLLTWARTGTPTYQYESAGQRAADIEAGIGRTPEELGADLRESAERFGRAVNEMPDAGWAQEVKKGPRGEGEAMPARRVLWSRLLEVEVHHVDLDAGYSPEEWAPAFARRALTETISAFSRRRDVPPFAVSAGDIVESVGVGVNTRVHGSQHEVLSWLIGRSNGAMLRVEPAGALPELPPWK